MLVSVDVDAGVVTLYGSTVQRIPISNVGKIATILRGKRVRYVREVLDVSGEEVIEMVEGIALSGDFNQVVEKEVGDGRMWMRATGSGQLYLKLDNKLKLQFQHPGDFVSMDKLGMDIADRFPVIRSLLNKRKLEIVGTVRMNEIKRQVAEQVAHREESMYGNMIVDTRIGGINPKHLGAALASGGGRGESIDMDNYTAPPSEADGLSDEQKFVLAQGWGAQKQAEVDGGEVEE